MNLEGKTYIPQGYHSVLNLKETQYAIETVKHAFQTKLANALHLVRVSAPLFVAPDTGLNDDLNGVERPVSFDIPAVGVQAQVVHSLAKWKRMALWRYGFQPGEGLYTDMNAIRRDEETDNLHSIYVDQWDWEKVITAEDRTEDYLKMTVNRIVNAIYDTLCVLKQSFPQLHTQMCRTVDFVTTQELEDLYPGLTPKERENAYVKGHPTTFLMQIGGKLRSGAKHDGRAPDYDDWKLNGDLLLWDEVLGRAIEVSSMGIRVDAKAMDSQLKEAGCNERRNLLFHKMLLSGELPLTIGGGIGQSRLCMILLGKAHIGEVQCSLWDSDTLNACEAAKIEIL